MRRFLGMKFTKQEWDRLIDRVVQVRGNMVLTELLREVLSEISEEDLLSLEVKEVGDKEFVVVKNAPVDERIHLKVKKVAKKRGVELQRLVAEALLKYYGVS